MSGQSTTTNKSKFQDGDVPSGADFSDLIDSFVNSVDTTAQTMAATLTTPGIVATIVSASSGYYTSLRVADPTGGLYAASANFDVCHILQANIDSLTSTLYSTITLDATHVSAAGGFVSVLQSDSLNATAITSTIVSAANVNATAVSAGGLWLTGSFNWNGETTVRASVGTATTPMPLTAQGFIVAMVGGVSVRIPFFRG